MHYSQHTNFPPLNASFKEHRSRIDQFRFKVDLTLPTPLPPPAWATLPSPPMSGSPPPDHPPSPRQIAGQRRKRSPSPPPVTTASSSLPTTFYQGPPTYGPPPPRDQQGYHPGQGVQYPGPYQSGPPMAYGGGPTLVAAAPSPVSQHYPGPSLSPRSSRKNKAHVASACINCKKKHLRCDNARPCRRCVQSGKEDSCEDVVHKKRGRPPLRPEDPSSRRSFDAGLLTDPARRMPTTDPASYAQSGQYSRGYRPLQAQPSYEPPRPQWRPGQPYGLYSTPSIGSSSAVASGQFTPSRGYGPGPQLSAQSGPSYTTAASGPSARPLAPYPPSYGYMQEPIRPPPPGGYSAPLFPRSQLPHPGSDPSVPSGGSPSLQLPPIRSPAERGSIDPSLTQPGPSQIAQYPPNSRADNGTTRQPDPKRPRMDIQGILGPKHD